jgi:catechol 2,3-dioxygenase-like lactoylglutathione lyase family enzyme
MTNASWTEICVSNFEQSITWFENVLGFRVEAREANEYAELSRGETSIQLGTDDAPYWESERSHLLPPGQRGSGVEIILLVEDINAVYHQAQQAQADIVREIADYPWHMRQFWVRHPDGYLIRPAQKILSVNPTIYHSQVAAAFQRDVPLITEALAPVKETANTLARQQDYLGAATIYETLVTQIFEESHLYYEEEEPEYDDYYEEEQYYPEEEGLKEFVEECIEALGTGLADERADRVAREKIIEVLFDIYEQDLHADDSLGFTDSASDQLIKYTTTLERNTIAERLRKKLAGAASLRRGAYGKFLLGLQKDTLDDEAYLQICRDAGLTSALIDRLLTLGRVDEAERETQRIDDHFLLGLADLFIQHQQDAVAERLVRGRIKEKPDTSILKWLQNYYHARDNQAAELEITENLFRTQRLLSHYQKLRDLARQLDRWETLRPKLFAFLEQAQDTKLLIEIALDEGDIDKALKLLKTMAKKDSYGYTYTSSGYGFSYYDTAIDLDVAKAAEETRPREAIQLYQQRAERLIAMRERKNYQAACTHLAKVRTLYQKLGEHETWTSYIATLREKNRSLRALKEELTKAGL